MVMMVMMMTVMVVMMAGGGCLVGYHGRGCLHRLGRFSPRYDPLVAVIVPSGWCNGAGSGDGNGGSAGRVRAGGGGSGGCLVGGGGWSQAETIATPRRDRGYLAHARGRAYVAEVNRGTGVSSNLHRAVPPLHSFGAMTHLPDVRKCYRRGIAHLTKSPTKSTLTRGEHSPPTYGETV